MNFKKRNISYLTGSTFPPRCPGGEHIGRFIIRVRTRRQSNTSHAAQRFKTIRGVLHTCYIATFGVLTFIVLQGRKNVLLFIECTESETPPLVNPPGLEGTLTRLRELDLKCYPELQLFGRGMGLLQQEGLLLSAPNPTNFAKDMDTGVYQLLRPPVRLCVLFPVDQVI